MVQFHCTKWSLEAHFYVWQTNVLPSLILQVFFLLLFYSRPGVGCNVVPVQCIAQTFHRFYYYFNL